MADPCDAPESVKRDYARRLPKRLVKDHGRKRRYSRDEVDRSVGNAGLDIDWVCWAYVLCLDQAAFDAIHAATGEACDYTSMHTEMGGYLADAAKSGGWALPGFDWSWFDLSNWDWPDVSDWFSFDGGDGGDGGMGDFGGGGFGGD